MAVENGNIEIVQLLLTNKNIDVNLLGILVYITYTILKLWF